MFILCVQFFIARLTELSLPVTVLELNIFSFFFYFSMKCMNNIHIDCLSPDIPTHLRYTYTQKTKSRLITCLAFIIQWFDRNWNLIIKVCPCMCIRCTGKMWVRSKNCLVFGWNTHNKWMFSELFNRHGWCYTVFWEKDGRVINRQWQRNEDMTIKFVWKV